MKITKEVLILLISVVTALPCMSQDSYDNAMKQAKGSINKKDYPAALQLYNSAKAFEPANSVIVDDSINRVFKLILAQKKEAESNFALANAQKKRADSLLLVAQNALKISNANQIMYEAQGVVKLDPTLALHLAAAALDSIKNITMDSSFIDDSLLIVDKANRIYYENNFRKTLIGGTNKPDLGKFTRVFYSPNDASIWTITDKFYAIKWKDGEIVGTINLDTTYTDYTFKVVSNDSLLLYGIDHGTGKHSKSIKVWVIKKGDSYLPYAKSFDTGFIVSGKDSIWLNGNESKGWTKRSFVFDDRILQFDSVGKIALLDSVRGSILHAAFSPDGGRIAIANSSRGLKIFDTKGTLEDNNINIGGIPGNLEFTPDNRMILVKQSNYLQFFQASDLQFYSTLYFSGSLLQSYQLASKNDTLRLLVSVLSGNQQVITLYTCGSRSIEFKVYAQYKCPGSAQTSAVFLNDRTILSSSDKIRSWEIPSSSAQPDLLQTNSEFISSIHLGRILYKGNTTFTCITFNGDTLNYQYHGDGSVEMIHDSSFNNSGYGVITPRLSLVLPNERTLIVSEDGQLQLYHSKMLLNKFLENFPFDPFTDEQKERYGLVNKPH
jgi:hypothetical protein